MASVRDRKPTWVGAPLFLSTRSIFSTPRKDESTPQKDELKSPDQGTRYQARHLLYFLPSKSRTDPTLVNHKVLALLLLLLFVSTAPALAVDAGGKDTPFGMMTAFTYNPLPWAIGVLSDAAIYFKSLSKGKNFQTAATGLVLGFGGIWFTWVGVGGMQLFAFPPAALYAIAVAVCVVVLCVCKIISYWVINEKFPAKKTMLLYIASGALMTAASFAATQL